MKLKVNILGLLFLISYISIIGNTFIPSGHFHKSFQEHSEHHEHYVDGELLLHHHDHDLHHAEGTSHTHSDHNWLENILHLIADLANSVDDDVSADYYLQTINSDLKFGQNIIVLNNIPNQLETQHVIECENQKLHTLRPPPKELKAHFKQKNLRAPPYLI